jgi:hypothetical protein
MKAALFLFAVMLGGLTAQVRVAMPNAGPPQEQETGTASVEGAVVDALTHEPVKKASVMLGGRIGFTAVTDASGHFAFRQLPAGQYSVQAQGAGYPVGRFSLELARQASLTVAADEHKREITLSLTPGASVRGRIVDEEGSPMPQCNVSAMQRTTTERSNGLVNAGGGARSDENGEYRIANLPAGKYYLMANCPQTIPLPHAFIRRGSVDNLPMLAYRNLSTREHRIPPARPESRRNPAGSWRASISG